MVKYYNFKEDNPEYHEDVNPLDLRHIGEDDIMTVLPYREQTGRRILLYRIGKIVINTTTYYLIPPNTTKYH